MGEKNAVVEELQRHRCSKLPASSPNPVSAVRWVAISSRVTGQKLQDARRDCEKRKRISLQQR